MSKAVMLSIQPKWCELIASRKKTVEVRKTRPKLETPFKCYIYETKGKVIGEFICSNIAKGTSQLGSCLTMQEISEYANNKEVYGWCISGLVIYNEPKELNEFYRLGKPLICDSRNCENCKHLKYMQVNSDEWDYDCDCQHQLENHITLKRPPQSWCYVEELSGA